MIMPMDDEFEQFDPHKQQQQHGMSKAEQRRSNKPIMEKRRRARINHCLNELKTLILDAMKKDPARHSKLEKADILEMTVKHLQSIQRQQLAVAVATDPSVLHKFKTGFNECAGEVSRYISGLEGVDVCVKQRLVSHLASCVTGLQQLSPFAFGNTNVGVLPGLPQDLNNNQRTQHLQLIPSRLPTGELALLVPNSNNMPFFPPSANVPSSTVTSANMDRSHPSAFTAVSRADLPNTSRSPPLSPTSSTSSDDSEPQYQPFKVPLVSPSGFRSFHHPAEQKSPQQHSVVSSTCPPPEGAPTFAHVKLEFKTVAIPRGVVSTPASQQPLTVVTSPSGNEQLQVKNPLDFSMRKDNTNTSSRQCASTQTSSIVLTKRQFPVNFEGGSASSELISSSLGSPNKMPRYSFTVNPGAAGGEFYRGGDYLEGERHVTTSTSRPSTSSAVAAADSKDMWRPW